MTSDLTEHDLLNLIRNVRNELSGSQSTVVLPSPFPAAPGLGPQAVSTPEVLSVFYEVWQAAIRRLGHESYLLKQLGGTNPVNSNLGNTRNEAMKEVIPNMTNGTCSP